MTTSTTSPPAVDEALAVRGLVQHFVARRSWADRLSGTPAHVVKAVDGVDLTLHKGETLGLVGAVRPWRSSASPGAASRR